MAELLDPPETTEMYIKKGHFSVAKIRNLKLPFFRDLFSDYLPVP